MFFPISRALDYYPSVEAVSFGEGSFSALVSAWYSVDSARSSFASASYSRGNAASRAPVWHTAPSGARSSRQRYPSALPASWPLPLFAMSGRVECPNRVDRFGGVSLSAFFLQPMGSRPSSRLTPRTPRNRGRCDDSTERPGDRRTLNRGRFAETLPHQVWQPGDSYRPCEPAYLTAEGHGGIGTDDQIGVVGLTRGHWALYLEGRTCGGDVHGRRRV